MLAQEFVADAPNQRWVADTTEFVIGSSGKLYLAAMLDLYSRFLVGWTVSAINDRHRHCCHITVLSASADALVSSLAIPNLPRSGFRPVSELDAPERAVAFASSFAMLSPPRSVFRSFR
ncbi:MAG: DDE-type integrase/transposase/recombinase [Planctomycetes bacterium]|nr:DDE-type integrase/transposase/recombinase [Planctomycetota bacterium]